MPNASQESAMMDCGVLALPPDGKILDAILKTRMGASTSTIKEDHSTNITLTQTKLGHTRRRVVRESTPPCLRSYDFTVKFY